MSKNASNRNLAAKDLASTKYHQRIVKNKKKYDRKNSDRDYE